jgi:hypothetical protein
LRSSGDVDLLTSAAALVQLPVASSATAAAPVALQTSFEVVEELARHDYGDSLPTIAQVRGVMLLYDDKQHTLLHHMQTRLSSTVQPPGSRGLSADGRRMRYKPSPPVPTVPPAVIAIASGSSSSSGTAAPAATIRNRIPGTTERPGRGRGRGRGGGRDGGVQGRALAAAGIPPASGRLPERPIASSTSDSDDAGPLLRGRSRVASSAAMARRRAGASAGHAPASASSATSAPAPAPASAPAPALRSPYAVTAPPTHIVEPTLPPVPSADGAASGAAEASVPSAMAVSFSAPAPDTDAAVTERLKDELQVRTMSSDDLKFMPNHAV